MRDNFDRIVFSCSEDTFHTYAKIRAICFFWLWMAIEYLFLLISQAYFLTLFFSSIIHWFCHKMINMNVSEFADDIVLYDFVCSDDMECSSVWLCLLRWHAVVWPVLYSIENRVTDCYQSSFGDFKKGLPLFWKCNCNKRLPPVFALERRLSLLLSSCGSWTVILTREMCSNLVLPAF